MICRMGFLVPRRQAGPLFGYPPSGQFAAFSPGRRAEMLIGGYWIRFGVLSMTSATTGRNAYDMAFEREVIAPDDFAYPRGTAMGALRPVWICNAEDVAVSANSGSKSGVSLQEPYCLESILGPQIWETPMHAVYAHLIYILSRHIINVPIFAIPLACVENASLPGLTIKAADSGGTLKMDTFTKGQRGPVSSPRLLSFAVESKFREMV